MPLTVIRSLENNLSLKAKDFLLTMQEFFLFSMRAFFTLPKLKRYWRDFLDQATICGTDSIPIVLVSAVSIGSLLAIEVGNLLEDFGAKTMLGRSTSISVNSAPCLWGSCFRHASARVTVRNSAP